MSIFGRQIYGEKSTGTISGPRNPGAWTFAGWEGLSGKHHYIFSSPKTLPQASTVDQCQRLVDLASICELKQKKPSYIRVAGESGLNAVRYHLRRQ